MSDFDAVYRELMQHRGVCMAMLDETGGLLHVNPPLCALLGRSQAALQALRLVDLLHPEEVQTQGPRIAALLAGSQEHVSDEMCLLHAEQREVWCIVAISRLTPASLPGPQETDPGIPRAFVSIQDITPLPLAVEQLKRTVAELECRNQELEELTYVISHHLREPLRGIFNYLSILQDEHRQSFQGDGLAILDKLLRLSRRVDAQLQSLLSLSRAGLSALMAERTDMRQLAVEAVENLAALMEARHARVHIPDSLPEAVCDRMAVAELWQILIGNALRYSDHPAGCVEIGSLDGPARVYYVRDDGIGIPEQDQDTIFMLFKRLHAHGRYGEGSGAGLSIARKIVSRHGGRLWVDSIPGQGSTFYFTLSGGEDAHHGSNEHSG
ncbi:sensor histidine kinase [Megalodesulfovibrio paquesii]